MYKDLSPLKLQGPNCAISSFSEYILFAKNLLSSEKVVTMAEWERSAVMTLWISVRIMLISHF